MAVQRGVCAGRFVVLAVPIESLFTKDHHTVPLLSTSVHPSIHQFMIAHSQPIALPASAVPTAGGSSMAQQDYAMHDAGSYTGGDAEGTFNPASFTRHFLGSPISWRASSWGMHNARFPAGSPTAQLLSSIECVSSCLMLCAC